MKRFAFIDQDNKCTTVIVSESRETLNQIPGGAGGIELPDDSPVSQDWIYQDGVWTEPTPELEN